MQDYIARYMKHARAWMIEDMTATGLAEDIAAQIIDRGINAWCRLRIGRSDWSAAECRSQMSLHHPDKGGDPELFTLWHARFEYAKAQGA